MTQASEDFELHVASWAQFIKLAGEGLREGERSDSLQPVFLPGVRRKGGLPPQLPYMSTREISSHAEPAQV